jgi:prepilin peptidase CpaA
MAGLCILLTVACGYDYRKKKIPNYLTAVMAVSGVCLRFGREGAGGAAAYVCGCLCVMCLLYPVFKIGAVGAGDVKLFGVSAGFLPFGKIFYFLFLSLLIAALISFGKMWKEKIFGERIRYLLDYLRLVAESGRWLLYPDDHRESGRTGICLSGPILVSVLLYWGGAY